MRKMSIAFMQAATDKKKAQLSGRKLGKKENESLVPYEGKAIG